MLSNEIAQKLEKALAEMDIIDCHEHLGPEKERIDSEVDVFTLVSHYTRGDLQVAGMSESDYQLLFDRRLPLEQRWRIFKPFWEQIRWGSYARAALLAARRFYGFEDINDHTYEALSEAIRAANRPGLYDHVLRDACRIRVALTQCGRTDLGHDALIPVMPMLYGLQTWQDLTDPPFASASIRTLDDYLDAVRAYVTRVKAQGAVGLKMMSAPYHSPDRKAADEAFSQLRRGHISSLPVTNPLRDYVTDEIISFASQQGLVICVHTGYWGDFRQLDPLHMIPLLQRHQKARFDIYHLGYPWVRETLMLGKGFPNVWLNLCWTHIISQRFATEALDEAIDLIPTNKLLAFGGDYGAPVEKVYGHLVMAREDIAGVLARRIVRRQMNESQALELARRWLWDNPKDLYNLDL